MRVILGIGNPGLKYHQTAHNVGFLFLDALLAQGSWKKHGKSLIQKTFFLGQDYLLVKPQTFVNLTGEVLLSVLSFYKKKLSQVLVIVDDVNLPFGEVRIRFGGSAGGHNGLKSIIDCCGQNFPRLRIGIGRCPSEWNLSNWVLRKFTQEEMDYIGGLFEKTQEIAETGFSENWEKAIQKYNSKSEFKYSLNKAILE